MFTQSSVCQALHKLQILSQTIISPELLELSKYCFVAVCIDAFCM